MEPELPRAVLYAPRGRESKCLRAMPAVLNQGKGNVVLIPAPDHVPQDGSPLQCRERLGGLLKYYDRDAA